MAYNTLKSAIQAAIKNNDNEEITGNVLQGVLLSIVNSVGSGYNFAGVATPSTNPGTPDGAMFWIADKGTYTNFGNTITVAAGFVGVFMWDGSAFTRQVIKISGGEGIFDVTGYTGNSYASLSAALAAIPQEVKAGGMTIRFVHTSDNNYVRFNLIADEFTTDVSQWQSMNEDNEPSADSKNLAISGGIYLNFYRYITKSLGINHSFTTDVATPIVAFPVEKNKSYHIFVKASDVTEAVNTGIFENVGGVNTLYQQIPRSKFLNGFVFEYITTQDNVSIAIRTNMVGSVVECYALKDFYLVPELQEELNNIEKSINDVNQQILGDGSITFDTTGTADWTFHLDGGDTYILYAQSNDTLTNKAGWYKEGVIFHQFVDISEGEYFEYTPESDMDLQIRANVIGAKINWKVIDHDLRQTLERINAQIAAIATSVVTTRQALEGQIANLSSAMNDQTLDEGTIIAESTGLLSWTASLKGGNKYILYAQSANTLGAKAGFYDYVQQVKVLALPTDISNGYTVEYTPVNDIVLGLRTQVEGAVLNYKVSYTKLSNAIDDINILSRNNKKEIDNIKNGIDAITPLHNYWQGKNISAYGDSITNQSGGNYSAPWNNMPTSGTRAYPWAYYVARELNFANYFGRGVGAQTFSWDGLQGLNGGSVTFYNATTGEVQSRNDEYDYDNYEGHVDVPTGCVAGRGCFCSWNRIITSYPASMKDTVHMILVMGGTNDPEWDTDFEWVPNSVVDPEWAASDYYSIFGGDYNIRTFQGGLVSTIMKLHVWMPNAIIVLMTPTPSNHPSGTIITGLKSLVTYSYLKSEKIRRIANIMSIPLIDVNAETGINALNSTEFLGDGVHPNNNGKRILAKTIVGKLKTILPDIPVD